MPAMAGICTGRAVKAGLVLRHNVLTMSSSNCQSESHHAPRYVQIGLRMAQLIESGAFKPGQRLPSVRDTAALQGVSLATAMQAFRWLEERGLAQARPKVGYFAKTNRTQLAVPHAKQASAHSGLAAGHSRTELLAMRPAGDPEAVDGVNLGGTCPRDSSLFDESRVRIALSRATRVHRRTLVEYTGEEGTLAFKNAVARRALHLGCALQPQNVQVAFSCIHAVSLCLMAVTRPGDVVALESPTFFGFLDLLESMNLRVVEIPSHPRTGMSLQALALALETQPIRAVVAVPTLSNPLGAIMPLAQKKALVHLLASHQVPLIEDVVFNDLLASDERRRAAKAFDEAGGVMVCGSFSKTLTPGVRLGWLEAGRWRDQVASLKRVHGVATNEVLEHALADLLTQSAYEPQMRRLAVTMAERLRQARQIIAQSFPKGTRVSNPVAGYTLWVELPHELDSMHLFDCARAQGIRFGPGRLFSASDRYNHCLRLSFSGTWGPREQEGLAQLGQLAKALLDELRA